MDKDRIRHATISLSVRLIQLYDQICGIEIDGEYVSVSSAAELDRIILNTEIGSVINLQIRRGVEVLTASVTVFEYYE